MKHLKIYEEYIDATNVNQYPELMKKYKFKIGDYVRVPLHSGRTQIFQVRSIDTNYDNQPYHMIDLRPEYQGSVYASSGNELELVPDYEMAAIKYNI